MDSITQNSKNTKRYLPHDIKSMCQVNVGNFLSFFSNPSMSIASTLLLFLNSLNKT